MSTEAVDDGGMEPQAITVEPSRRILAPVFIQAWEPCVFIHWPVDADAVTPLLPPECAADTYDGQTYVGLIPLVIRRAQVFGNRPLGKLSNFTELNVRLYSVDAQGRRGIVFRSLDAERYSQCWSPRPATGCRTNGLACRTSKPATSTAGRRSDTGRALEARGRGSACGWARSSRSPTR